MRTQIKKPTARVGFCFANGDICPSSLCELYGKMMQGFANDDGVAL